MPRSGIKIFSPGPDTIAVTLQIHCPKRFKLSHIACINHANAMSTPLTGVQISVAIGNALRFGRFLNPDMNRTGGIAHIHTLDSVLARGQK